MHSHCEIIMPKTKNIGAAIDSILEPFSENKNYSDNSFWDFYVIGGRFAGQKEMCNYDSNKLDDFYKALNEKKITVTGLQCGKQTINPPEQIPEVDKLWNEFFPTENGEIVACPIFSHSNDQYDSDDLISCDICRVEEIPPKLFAARVIIAAPTIMEPKYKENKIEAVFMTCQNIWNGVNFEDTGWDGNVLTALETHKKKITHYKEEYKQKITPQPDWLCVTVDYHS